jgi:nucleotide-binding universal stress UspA family protein
MFKSILVPVDGSVQSGIAIRYALELAKRFGGHLTGLHVVDSKVLEAPYLTDLAGLTGAIPFTGLMTEVRQSLERRGRQILEDFRQVCLQQGQSADLQMETGVVHRTIAQASMRHDLICMGRTSEGSEWIGHLLGTTLENTLRRVHVPVLLAGDLYREPRRVLIAFDGSVFANAALRVAIQLLEGFGGECTLLGVATHAEEAVPMLENARKLLTSHGIAFTEQARAGDPREQICLTARQLDIDLIVMGAFGHSRMREVLLGSTTDAVMRTCPLPLLIARA